MSALSAAAVLAAPTATALAEATLERPPEKSSERLQDHPNIIVILADDMGYGDLSVQGAKDISTTHIDALAAQGVRLTDYYANQPVCAPSRAGLMTGRYQERFGFETNPGAEQRTSTSFGLPRDHKTLPERLKDLGYATGMVGKWHMGFTPTNQPTARGFDSFFGFLDGAMAYVPGGNGGKALMRGTQPAPMVAHTTEAFTDEAVKFIDANKDRPFFLYEAYNAVHAPLQSTKAYLDRFASEKDPKRRTHLAMVAALDEGVGKIVEAVDRAGLSKKTLIVFISDNGGPTWQTTSSNGPLNGVKDLTLEGGIRVPAIFRWPGRLPQGKVVHSMAMEFDVTATALALAGAHADPIIEGRNLMPYLTGAKTGDVHERLFWRMGPQAAERQGSWKLVKAEDAYWLFDLSHDIGEHHDLATANPAKMKQMRAEFDAWSAQMATPQWEARIDKAPEGKLKTLVSNYIKGLPVEPRELLYGGGPE
ncbi:sulfatase-like hydrolase/transferase [Phenylobacterium sp.]|uniref:sulfatase-like hydrolase/transferase n=1 Tax=Phenylobacterium sp. TaxID=1871053 RepID=UPI002F401D69